jgi:signal transduction histidine kinase
VEEHGGKIWAENNDVQGATFVVQIPASDNRKEHKGDLLVQAT